MTVLAPSFAPLGDPLHFWHDARECNLDAVRGLVEPWQRDVISHMARAQGYNGAFTIGHPMALTGAYQPVILLLNLGTKEVVQ